MLFSMHCDAGEKDDCSLLMMPLLLFLQYLFCLHKTKPTTNMSNKKDMRMIVKIMKGSNFGL